MSLIFANLRYPDDPSDRVWEPKPSLGPTNQIIRGPNAIIFNANHTMEVPLQVLRTALTDPDRLEILHNDLETEDYEYVVFLYFLELNDTVEPGQRLFDIYLNNESKSTAFDVLGNFSSYKEVVFNVRANGSLNVTLVKAPGSVSGPICNAYEILQVHQWVQQTSLKDGKFQLFVKKYSVFPFT